MLAVLTSSAAQQKEGSLGHCSSGPTNEGSCISETEPPEDTRVHCPPSTKTMGGKNTKEQKGHCTHATHLTNKQANWTSKWTRVFKERVTGLQWTRRLIPACPFLIKGLDGYRQAHITGFQRGWDSLALQSISHDTTCQCQRARRTPGGTWGYATHNLKQTKDSQDTTYSTWLVGISPHKHWLIL